MQDVYLKKCFTLSFQGEPSILNRFMHALREWAGGGGSDVQLLTVEPLREALPATRVWLSSTVISNLNHVLLYHKNEVRKTEMCVFYLH